MEFSKPTVMQAVPLPVLRLAGIVHTGCRYQDQFESIWLADGFEQTGKSLSELIKGDPRPWTPVDIAGHEGEYTSGMPDDGAVVMLVRVSDELVFSLEPYKNYGSVGWHQPGTSAGNEAPPWVKKVSERLATVILK